MNVKDIYPLDRRIMYCKKCGSKLHWDSLFVNLICSKCGKKHDPIEIRDRMWKSESSFDSDRTKYDKESDKNGILQIDIGW